MNFILHPIKISVSNNTLENLSGPERQLSMNRYYAALLKAIMCTLLISEANTLKPNFQNSIVDDTVTCGEGFHGATQNNWLDLSNLLLQDL